MNRALALSLAVCGLLALAVPAAHAEERAGARLWVAAGPAFDQSVDRNSGSTGYSLGVGAEFGRTVAFTVEAGLEHYPSGFEPYLQDNPLGSPPVYRVVAEGGRSVISGTVGGRVFLPFGAFEPFLEVAIGMASNADPGRRYLDAATGAQVYPVSRSGSGAIVGDVGLGLRTRRHSGYGGMIAFRSRSTSEGFEGRSAQSYQLRIGILTP